MGVYIFDGAMGTMLQQRGLEPGQSPEEMNLTKPEIVESIHLDYLAAGADILITNSFGGSPAKLEEYQLQQQTFEINRRAVEIAKSACEKAGRGMVAASIGPTGYFVEPLGDVGFADMVEIFRQQAEGLAAGAPDYFLLETFSDLGEIRAALLACKQVSDIPVICSMTYMGTRTLTGVSPASAVVTLEAMGAAVIGCNCSGGPEELLPVIAEMAQYTNLPLVVQPNAGLPQVNQGEVYYPLDAAQFSTVMQQFQAYQVQFMGGCCGTTPEHITQLKQSVATYQPQPRQVPVIGTVASAEQVVFLGGDTLVKMIGERINPTARKKLAQSLRDGDLSMIQQEAELQIQAGAHLLDVNVGTHQIDEVQTMAEVLGLLQQCSNVPLCIDSTTPAVLQRGLQVYHGKALINSINGEQASMDAILPLAKRYGAAVVALTLDEQGIPATAQGRLEIAQRMVQQCAKYGIAPHDIYVDALVLTVGTDIHGPKETLRSMKLIKEQLGVNLLLGVSNVSYGLPNRPKINSAFLAMAISHGLDVAIINPLDEMMHGSWQSASLLMGRDERSENYLAHNTQTKVAEPVIEQQGLPTMELVSHLVVKGGRNITKVISQLLEEGHSPMDVINQGLIPGLNEVGQRYEQGIFFLPQLMLSAETAQKGFQLLESHFEEGQQRNKGTMVIGTVKGDIHDIGKNMVAVMVKNHGYRVIDLGKNVPLEDFVHAVVEHQAQFLGLSALMTTTMMEIPKIIQAIRQHAPQTKVMIGGAVITPEFAQEVGADGYGKDAVTTVKWMDHNIDQT